MQLNIDHHRILVIDDNPEIHDDFDAILNRGRNDSDLDSMVADFLGSAPEQSSGAAFQYAIDHALQGQEGVELLRAAVEQNTPYATAFVDMRMPPGWDGVETIKNLWAVDPDLQVVICTAYSDYSFEEIVDQLGQSDQLLILKKPFDAIEVAQLARAMSEKRRLLSLANCKINHLEELVAVHTQELHAALAESNQASAAKTEFLANISHEIRTPLTSILGYLEQYLDNDASSNLTAEQLRAVQVIRQSGHHLMEIINTVLDLSKIAAQKLVAEKTVCSPADILRAVADSMQLQAEAKGIAFQLKIDADVPARTISDPLRLKQVLINLVGNAVKFTNQGRVEVQLSADVSRNVLKFTVTDTGVGIPVDKLERILEPFEQADTSTTREFGGTGLGLAVSRQLVQLLEGELLIHSEPGLGSEFSVEIPIQQPQPKVDCEQVAATSEPVDNAQPLDGLNLLLAEDDLVNQFLVQEILTKAGARVDVADNGLQAYEFVADRMTRREQYDAVLMDMQMPELDGYGATRRLRTEGYQGAIIALTAHALDTERDKCLEAGCSDFTTKPIDRAALFGLIRTRSAVATSDSARNRLALPDR